MFRLRQFAIEVFKCVKKQNPDYMNDLFNVKDINYDLRDSSWLEQHMYSSKRFGFKSFSYYGSKLWNHIPAAIKITDDLEIFKTEITDWCRTAQAQNLEIC